MSPMLPVPGTLVAGKYRIEGRLGRGGMGTVFRAQHELIEQPVALKWLHPEYATSLEWRERFLREARASGRIRHPNVVQLFDVGMHEGALFLVMELVDGVSFEELLARGELSIPQALRLLVGAMRGVAEAHAHGVLHRDIKPDNILIARDLRHVDGIAKVVDFGISQLLDEEAQGKRVTRTGEVMGTPEYMSYEHIAGARDLDARTDVYSFGVLLYRTLTGISPFEADSAAAIAVLVATHTPPLPSSVRPELPASLDAIVMRAMALKRDERYPNLLALIDALSAATSTDAYLHAACLPEEDDEAPRASSAPGTTASMSAERARADMPSTSSRRHTKAVPNRRRAWLIALAALMFALGTLGFGRLAQTEPSAVAKPPKPVEPNPKRIAPSTPTATSAPTLRPTGPAAAARAPIARPAVTPPVITSLADPASDWQSPTAKPTKASAAPQPHNTSRPVRPTISVAKPANPGPAPSARTPAPPPGVVSPQARSGRLYTADF